MRRSQSTERLRVEHRQQQRLQPRLGLRLNFYRIVTGLGVRAHGAQPTDVTPWAGHIRVVRLASRRRLRHPGDPAGGSRNRRSRERSAPRWRWRGAREWHWTGSMPAVSAAAYAPTPTATPKRTLRAAGFRCGLLSVRRQGKQGVRCQVSGAGGRWEVADGRWQMGEEGAADTETG